MGQTPQLAERFFYRLVLWDQCEITLGKISVNGCLPSNTSYPSGLGEKQVNTATRRVSSIEIMDNADSQRSRRHRERKCCEAMAGG